MHNNGWVVGFLYCFLHFFRIYQYYSVFFNIFKYMLLTTVFGVVDYKNLFSCTISSGAAVESKKSVAVICGVVITKGRGGHLIPAIPQGQFLIEC